jgi:hypothetical protein
MSFAVIELRPDPPPVNYFLEAWIEGHYACHCHQPRSECPYPHGSGMADAWSKGWETRDAWASPPQRESCSQPS